MWHVPDSESSGSESEPGTVIIGSGCQGVRVWIRVRVKVRVRARRMFPVSGLEQMNAVPDKIPATTLYYTVL